MHVRKFSYDWQVETFTGLASISILFYTSILDSLLQWSCLPGSGNWRGWCLYLQTTYRTACKIPSCMFDLYSSVISMIFQIWSFSSCYLIVCNRAFYLYSSHVFKFTLSTYNFVHNWRYFMMANVLGANSLQVLIIVRNVINMGKKRCSRKLFWIIWLLINIAYLVFLHLQIFSMQNTLFVCMSTAAVSQYYLFVLVAW